jgi:uncharacterized protein YdaU (DUF1376 family)
MSKTPFMQLWVSDFIADTTDLDAVEFGAYMLIILAMWKKGGSLPDNEVKMRRIARCGRSWPRVWLSIKDQFVVKDGHIINERLAEEHASAVAKVEVNRHNGARGGRAKALNNNKATLANGSNSLEQLELEPELEVGKRDTKVSTKKATRLPDDWVAPQEWIVWAISSGTSRRNAYFEADQFKDYWIGVGGQRGTKLNWEATWRNWIRRNTKGKSNGNGINHGQTRGDAQFDEARERALRIGYAEEAPKSGGF